MRSLLSLRWVCLFTTSLFLLGCTPEEEVMLRSSDRVLIDSLVRKEITQIRLDVDSLCELRFDSMVRYYADSIIAERTSERDRYLERIRRELENDQ